MLEDYNGCPYESVADAVRAVLTEQDYGQGQIESLESQVSAIVGSISGLLQILVDKGVITEQELVDKAISSYRARIREEEE